LNLWIRRWIDFRKNYSESNIRNTQRNQYTMIYGWAETQRLQVRCKKITEQLGINNVWIIEWVGHDIAHTKYQDMILKLI
jgi:hypothetical protein